LILASAAALAQESVVEREIDKFGKSLCKAFALKCKSTAVAVPLPRAKPTPPTKPKREIAEKSTKPAKATAAAKPERKQVVKPVSSVSVEWPEPVKEVEPEKTDFPVASISKPPKPVAVTAPKGNMGDGCLEALKEARVDFTIPAMPVSAGKCDVEVPVRVTSIGRVVLTDKPTLSCRAASRLAAWISEVAEPVVLSKTGSPLAYVKTGPGYDCGGKSGEALALRNEHAAGDAIDLAAFATADGRMIGATGATSAEVRLLKGLTTSACGYFTTVLAPSASPGDHYHLDLGRHGKGGAARICE
jgi:hypothetical protein